MGDSVRASFSPPPPMKRLETWCPSVRPGPRFVFLPRIAAAAAVGGKGSQRGSSTVFLSISCHDSFVQTYHYLFITPPLCSLLLLFFRAKGESRSVQARRRAAPRS